MSVELAKKNLARAIAREIDGLPNPLMQAIDALIQERIKAALDACDVQALLKAASTKEGQ